MCCRRKQQQRLSGRAAQRQQCCSTQALAVNNSPTVVTSPVLQPVLLYPHWTEYQPRTMAGILVMGVALGLQEGGRKIKERRDERKAKKAALAAEAHGPAESSSSGAVRGYLTRRESRPVRKSEEARREQRRHSVSSERAHEDDAPPSYDEVARPTYEEAMRDNQHRS